MLSSWDNSVVTQLTIEHSPARLFENCSFFKIGAFIIAFKRNINSRIYPTVKCREKDGVIRVCALPALV